MSILRISTVSGRIERTFGTIKKLKAHQFRTLYKETRTANASIAPEVNRLQARDAQLSTTVSTMRNQQEAEQLQNLHQEYARINVRINQIQITNSSIKPRSQELVQQLQTSNLEINHVQTEVFDLRNSVRRNQSTQRRDAQKKTIFKCKGRK